MDQASAKMIYQNLACGVTAEAQAAALDCSVEEVRRVFREVGLKMANWMLMETVPYVPCQTPEAAAQNRKTVLQFLDGLNLDDIKVVYNKVRAARVAVE